MLYSQALGNVLGDISSSTDRNEINGYFRPFLLKSHDLAMCRKARHTGRTMLEHHYRIQADYAIELFRTIQFGNARPDFL
ncbi:MAG: hypothetical protein JWP08_18 [Bryobacterales bacterium]|nr:hypothetical protein [Bryobacterales bacterium]